MKSYRMSEALYGGQLTFRAGEHQPDASQSADSDQYDASGTLLPAAPPRHITQAERANMHPDRQDLEWPYCRGPWVGLQD
jgi:hypothetical protein